jgi:glucosylceramidase
MPMKLNSRTLILLSALTPLAAGMGCSADGPLRTTEILVTSEAGDKMAPQENLDFAAGRATGTVVEIFPDQLKQTIDGIGTSFTESSAFVLAHLDPAERKKVMRMIYGNEGADFTLTRTHIGSCDFSVEGKYSYAEVPGDTELEHFSIAPDSQGFDPARYPGIKDPEFDLLPMIKEALAIKADQGGPQLQIIGSAWTAPPWMKDIETYFIPISAANNWQGTGGKLKPEYEATYAAYLMKYLDAYAAEGVKLWGLTPVNEPLGNSGMWESMHFSAESQNEYIKKHLGPAIKNSDHGDIRLMIFDQNRDHLEEWAEVMFSDPETAPYLYGVAVHWYSSTFKVHEDILERVHQRFPEFAILHSEGCIDDLGKPAPDGVGDPEGFQESGWFQNDAFWWNKNATDWAYTAPWAGDKVDDHPIYTPVHRYARNIIVSLDHWMTGWVDWNIVLDAQGGPNHVGNFCGAPIMIDTDKGDVYYTPIYHVLAQLSRTIRPGDRAVQTSKELGSLDADALHACATIGDNNLLSVQLLNTRKEELPVSLQIGGRYVEMVLPGNCVQTVRVQL